MREEDFLKLKSGTDVRGTALGEKTDLTDEAVDAIVRAFLYWIEEKTGNRAKIIAVGHDSRLSAERICKTAVSAAQASGADVLFCRAVLHALDVHAAAGKRILRRCLDHDHGEPYAQR